MNYFCHWRGAQKLLCNGRVASVVGARRRVFWRVARDCEGSGQ
ncbi:hypothetical protein A2U01_0109154, partial [Trifolium medium]|nr:hypothetical protein [Trifolium medium]